MVKDSPPLGALTNCVPIPATAINDHGAPDGKAPRGERPGGANVSSSAIAGVDAVVHLAEVIRRTKEVGASGDKLTRFLD